MKQLLVGYLLLVFPLTIFATELVTLAIGNWEPYTSNRDKQGKILELLVQEAFELSAIDVEYKYFPWKRSLLYVLHGKFHGTFPWQKTKEKMADFYLNNEPILVEKTVFFTYKR